MTSRRNRLGRRRLRAFEPLEPRLALNVGPIANDDFYQIQQDTRLDVFPPTQKTFLELGGRVTIEAENFTTRAGGANGRTWVLIPDEGNATGGTGAWPHNARGGKYLQSQPVGFFANNEFTGPYLEYTVRITTPGTYRLYTRASGYSNNSNSVFVGINGLTGPNHVDYYGLTPDQDRNFNTSSDGTSWFSLGVAETTTIGNTPGGVPITWNIAAPGDYTIRYTMREDGMAIDALVLQLTSLPAPPADAPESPYHLSGSTAITAQGLDGYTGAVDTMLQQFGSGSAGPNADHGLNPQIVIDASDTAGGASQGLLRFNQLVGQGPGQVPPGATVQQAMLWLYVEDGGSGLRLHRMLAPWSESSSWNSLSGGIQIDNVEALATPDATIGAGNNQVNVAAGWVSINITAAVQAWVNGAANHGWAVLPLAGGTEDLVIASSDSARPPMLFVQALGAQQTLVAAGASWRYHDQGIDLGTAWIAPDYSDAAWSAGPAMLGYGRGVEATTISFGPNDADKYPTAYFRHEFNVSDPASITNLVLDLIRDDGAAVYLNGVEVVRTNLPAGATYSTYATAIVGDTSEWVFQPYSINPSLLVAGRNVLAAEVHQVNATSSDLAFNLRLTAVRGGVQPRFAGVLANDQSAAGGRLRAELVSGATSGLLAFNPDGSFSYVPAAGFFGDATFTYRAVEGSTPSNTATVTINVRGINTAPVAQNDAYLVLTGQTLNIPPSAGVLVNDTDPQNHPLTARLISSTSNGFLVLGVDGSISYTPNPGFVGIDTFTYRANDGELDSNLATVTVTVTDRNLPPVAVNDEYTVERNQSLEVTRPLAPPPVRAFFTDFNSGLPSQFSGSGALASVEGYANVGRGGNRFFGQFLRNTSTTGAPTRLTLTNLPAHTHIDLKFLLALIDSWDGETGSEAPDYLNVTVDGTLVFSESFSTYNSFNQSYSPVPETLLVDGEPLGFSAASGFDVDAAYDMGREQQFLMIPHSASTLVIEWFAGGAGWRGGANESFALENVEVVLRTASGISQQMLTDTGSIWRYLDNGSDQGTAWILPSYNDSGWASGPSMLGYGRGVEATTVGYGPNANNKYITTYFRREFFLDDSTEILDAVLQLIRDDGAAVYLNGVEVARSNLAAGVTFNTLASATVGDTSDWTFQSFPVDPALFVPGRNVLAAEVHQASASSSDLAFDLRLRVTTSVDLGVFGVLSNDFDPEGQPLTAQLAMPPQFGSVQLSSDGTFVYTPNPNFHGTDTFRYFAHDGYDESNVATVTITVVPGPNAPPVAGNDAYNLIQGGQLVVNAPLGVLVNDVDVDEDALTAVLLSQPAFGSVVLQPDGAFVYTPSPSFFGTDSFTYAASDSVAQSAPATVTLRVAPLGGYPVARADAYYFEVDQQLVVDAASGVLVNDVDEFGQSLTAELVTPPAVGALNLDPTGGFTYQPPAAYTGNASFTYRARAQDGSVNTATVTLAANYRPVASADAYPTAEDTVLIVPAAQGVLANDSDTDGDPLTAVLESGPAYGTLVLSPSGAFTYTPQANYFGQDSFTYRASDGKQLSAPSVVTIAVAAVNDPPVAVNDSYSTFEGLTLTRAAADGVLVNDFDIDGPALQAVLLQGPAGGNLTLNPDGSFVYVPIPGYIGTDTFTYQASDTLLLSGVATVTIEVVAASQLIVINEIMYNPLSADERETFVELYNRGAVSVNLAGWELRGAAYTFADATIAPFGYLVVAKDPAVFATLYPGVTNVIGPFPGTLSNRGERLELRDASNRRVDRVEYSDQGDWAVRRPGPLSFNSRGWIWLAEHDGGGRSLERITPDMPGNHGQNWASSQVDRGTPGAINSVHRGNLAPMILNVIHAPAVPKSNDSVTITARLLDELTTDLTATLFWRVSTANPGAFQQTPMLDDGLRGDGAAGDGVYGAILPPRADRTVVEFYVRAVDTLGNVRTWPGPTDTVGTQGANLLYQVDDSVYAGTQPIYRLIMSVPEANEFANINRNSEAQMNATFVAIDGTSEEVRYNAGMRVRGAGSRTRNPVGIRLNLARDRAWKEMTQLNLNTQYTWLQTTGMALFKLAGLPAPTAQPVQVRINGVNQASAGSPQFGSYVHVQPLGSEFVSRELPLDDRGNLYKKVRPANGWVYRNGNVAAYLNDGWSKQTNSRENNWSDLNEFLRVMNSATGPTYYSQVAAVANVEQFVRWFALNALLNNRETNLSNGSDDDYAMYRGELDPRFILIPHDLDTIFGMGDTATVPTATIWQAIDTSFVNEQTPPLGPFFRNPKVASMYYAALVDLMDTVFSANQLSFLLDNLLGGWIPTTTIEQMKAFAAARRAHVLSVIPRTMTVNHNLSVLNGYPRTTTGAVQLSGQADVVLTDRVLVGGVQVSWSPFDRNWTSAVTTGQQDTLLPAGSVWKYLDNGSDQGTAWRQPSFNDSAWASGPARLGYGGDGETTVVNCGPSAPACNSNNFPTTYFRTTFNVANPSQYTSLTLRLIRDDGAAVYLNGVEVVRDGLDANAGYLDWANQTVGGADEQNWFEYTIAANQLVAGVNQLAVEVHQVNGASSDLGFDLQLLGTLASAQTTLPVFPGVNRLVVQSLDAAGAEVERRTIDVWYDTGTTNPLPSTINGELLLTPQGGPYRVTGQVTITPTGELTILPGTTVYFDTGATLVVRGRLVAEGTATRRIRFTRQPAVTGVWGGLQFVDAAALESRLASLDIEYAQSRGIVVSASNSVLSLRDVTFNNQEATILSLANSSVRVTDSQFPNLAANSAIVVDGVRAGGELVIRGNRFGTTGSAPVIDVSNVVRPSPIAQVLDNRFAGGSSDGLRLRGAEAHVEGNVFASFRNSSGTGSATALAVLPGSAANAQVSAARNVFSDNDYAVLVSGGASYLSAHNVYAQSRLAAISLHDPGIAAQPGRGATLSGDLFWSNPLDLTGYYVDHPVHGTTLLEVNQSLLPASLHALGVGNVDGDPRLASPATGDYRLQSGSAAIGAGPNGLNIGADVPAWASVTGAPAAVTSGRNVALHVAGPGVTHYRYRVNGGGYLGETPVDQPIQLNNLPDGTYTVDVLGRNLAGVWQPLPTTRTWQVSQSHISVRINEVLAVNRSSVNHFGTYPDLIELYNYGSSSVSLAGMTISDNPNRPDKFVFPAGTTIAPGEYLVLFAETAAGAPGMFLGFSLSGTSGEGVYLYQSPAVGGALIDGVTFGIQLPDYSIARAKDGRWVLAQPTFGGPNRPVNTGDPSRLVINEWLANGRRLFSDDRIELHNSDPLPVNLGGLFLTDSPSGNPQRHEFPPLTFIAGSGYAVFIADGRPDRGADHVNFALRAQQDIIALLDANLRRIDSVVYPSQTTDVSYGRTPDAGTRLVAFAAPNFGLTNPTTQIDVETLIRFSDSWRYVDSGIDLGTAWRQPGFDDSAWAQGFGPLGYASIQPPIPIATQLATNRITYYFRRTFSVADPSTVDLSMTLLVDDGAIVYVNGIEVFRIGMPAGEPNANTLANRTVNTAAFEGPFPIPRSALVPGQNVIAVRVHNSASTSSDAVFGLSLDSVNTTTIGGTIVDPLKLLDHLRITELMYNPVGGDDYEYVEFFNTADVPLNLAGVQFTNGIDFVFPEFIIAPREYVVIVKNTATFQSRYGAGIRIAGEFGNRLSNAGEKVTLWLPQPFESAILDFDYRDDWYPVTDGSGPSLVIRDPFGPTASWNTAAAWRSSGLAQGSPGAADPLDGIPPRVMEILLDSPDWSDAFRAQLTQEGFGPGAFSLPLGASEVPIPPWANISRVRVEFSEEVIVTAGRLSLSGAAGGAYATSGFGYSQRVATWTLATPISADRLTLTLSDLLTDSAGNRLDGGPLVRVFDALPGDVNADLAVTRADLAATMSAYGSAAGIAGYGARFDVDGNGRVGLVDLVHVRNRLPLPPAAPAAAPGVPRVEGESNVAETGPEQPVLRATDLIHARTAGQNGNARLDGQRSRLDRAESAHRPSDPDASRPANRSSSRLLRARRGAAASNAGAMVHDAALAEWTQRRS